MFDPLLVPFLGCLHVLQPRDLVFLQPAGLARKIGQIKQHTYSYQDRWQRLENEQPLPAFQAPASHVQQQPGDRCPDDGRNRDRQHEEADYPGAVHHRKPQGQIKEDAGEETGLARAEQQTKRIENPFVRNSSCSGYRWNKGERSRDDPPGDHDAGDPKPRANSLEKDVGRHLKQEIGDEKQPGTQSKGRLAETKRLVHMKLCEADIHAIEISNEITQDQKRYQPPHHLADYTPFQLMHGLSLPLFLSFGTSVTLDEFLSLTLVQSAVAFAPQHPRPCKPPASCNRIGKVADLRHPQPRRVQTVPITFADRPGVPVFRTWTPGDLSDFPPFVVT